MGEAPHGGCDEDRGLASGKAYQAEARPLRFTTLDGPESR
jgi:hypothetical protein